jgi:hypothetical protein
VLAAASMIGNTRQIPKSRIGSVGVLVKKYAELMSSRMGAGS